ncbi:hypothetical protein [Anabaena sp. 54]|uniref:hypothetical protein n=1 Tax=Anabaena sp. 54 TaxID=46231 RepID=UPI0025C1F813|nr:hypothetical protein [Anabaena sp. 54]MBO1067364.1 hypothetical protein [Anabaena sp. 54]
MSKPVRSNKSEALLKKPDRKIISNSSAVVKGLATQINYSTFYYNSQTSTPLLNLCKSCGYEVGNLIKCPGGRLAVKCGNCIFKKIKLLISQHRLTETLEVLEESGFTGDLALLFILGEIAAVGCGDA